MLVGSCLAGVAFLKGLGLVHALSHMVGATYDSHHGLTNAVILPQVLRFNRAAIEPRLAPVAQAMGLADARFDTFLLAIDQCLERLGIPASLAPLGLREEDIPTIARKAMGDPARQTNPLDGSQDDLQRLLVKALEGRRD